MPVDALPPLDLLILELDVHPWPHEVGTGEPILDCHPWVQRETVHRIPEILPREEAERVTNVDDSAVVARLHGVSPMRVRAECLKAAGITEQDGEAADVGVGAQAGTNFVELVYNVGQKGGFVQQNGWQGYPVFIFHGVADTISGELVACGTDHNEHLRPSRGGITAILLAARSPEGTFTHRGASRPPPSSSDVAIVGGGYVGIATAYHILKASSPPPKVFLFEAKDPCFGATGRSGGHLRPDYLMAAARNCKRYSASAAAEVVQFEARHLDVIKSLILSEAIDCDFAETESLAVLTNPEQVSTVHEAYESLKQASSFSNALLDNVEFYAGDDAPQCTGLRDAQGYFSTPAARVSPYKLLMALLDRCINIGLSLKTQTPVVSVKHAESDGHTLTMRS
ncbi:hypothetical protein IL306_010369 [Fusarium sp. DS 682]|nr:hypothetical protein IL306_010369 [Fusarium sp. DS 682]